MTPLRTSVVKGAEIAPWVPVLADLRIRVFREFPYLYQGSVDYERRYLDTYLRSPDSVAVLAFDGDRVVGASTGLPLAHESEEFLAPFLAAGEDPQRIFYCGESVLLEEYRGRGLYRIFFAERERQARRLGLDTSVFCAVERPGDHPLRPVDYQPLDGVWRRFGYRQAADLRTLYRWRDLGESGETDKPMVFWVKTL